MQESGLPELIPPICLSALWGQDTALVIDHTLSSSVLTIGSGCSLEAARLNRYCSPSWVPLRLRDSYSEESLMTVTFLFTDMAGNTLFLTYNILIKLSSFSFFMISIAALTLLIHEKIRLTNQRKETRQHLSFILLKSFGQRRLWPHTLPLLRGHSSIFVLIS